MPVDFNRVPPRVTVPSAPKPSIIVWLVLLILVLCMGAALTIATWPAGQPTNVFWFGFYAVGYPSMAWALLLCGRLAYGYTARNQAIAINRVSYAAEQACHDVASRPLAVLGYAWCFSADETENSFDGLRDGTTQFKPRLSAAVADKEVSARWIDIADQRFYPGNELSEHIRHETVYGWMLTRLIDRVAPQLSVLASVTKVQVELHLQSRLKPDVVETGMRRALRHRVPGLEFEIMPGEFTIPLFRADAWHDRRDQGKAHLLIAIELRDATSTMLSDGVAEAGVAMLVGARHRVSSSSPELCLHRPAKGGRDVVTTTIGLAARWSKTPVDRLTTGWTHGLPVGQATSIRRAESVFDSMHWLALETLVGDCAGVGPWLAVALAAEGARTTGDPQLALCGEGEELTALVCRLQT